MNIEATVVGRGFDGAMGWRCGFGRICNEDVSLGPSATGVSNTPVLFVGANRGRPRICGLFEKNGFGARMSIQYPIF
jgi:hypothetical protein